MFTIFKILTISSYPSFLESSKIYPYKAPQFVIGRFYVFYLEQEFFMALVIWKKEISHLNVIYQVQKLLRKLYEDTYEFLPPHLF